jgi:predicted secreted Zn-dependent protease
MPEVDAGPGEPRQRAERALTPAVEPAAEPHVAAAQVVAPSPLIGLPLLAADVWGAEERYFAINGSTPDELIASAKASVPADPHGMHRVSMAYAGPTVWQHQPSYVIDPSSGACTMTGLTSTVSYQATIPQWTSPSHVPAELLAWWQVVLEHIRQHEGQHIRIFADFAADLPARVSGQACDAWTSITDAWSAELEAAQSAFDAQEAAWEFPVYVGASGG